MENLNPVLLNIFSQLINCGEIYTATCFNDVGAKPKFLRLPAKLGVQAGGILNNGDNGFDFFRVQVLYQREDPPLGAIEAGRTSKLQDTDFFHALCNSVTEKEHVTVPSPAGL